MRSPRTVGVVAKTTFSPNMCRLRLGGKALADFPGGFEGGIRQADLPRQRRKADRTLLCGSRVLAGAATHHRHGGPRQCRSGRGLGRAGAARRSHRHRRPGACRKIDSAADWFVLAGDMSALPAIRVNLAHLPDDAAGHVVMEAMSRENIPRIALPPAMTVHRVVNPEPESPNTVLEDTVMAMSPCGWPESSARPAPFGSTSDTSGRCRRTPCTSAAIGRSERRTKA